MRTVLVTLLIALALAACGGGSGPTPSASAGPPDAGSPPQPDAGSPPQPDAGSPPPPGSHALTVSKNGSGTVRSSPAGIDCGGTCAATFTDGTSVSLTATPDDGWTFSGWGGGCSGGDGCTITVHADATIWATFEAKAPPPTCPTGTYQCGAGHCTPNGDVCCASAGHEELYCPPAYTCTTDGRCAPSPASFLGTWVGFSYYDNCVGERPGCSHWSAYEERRFETAAAPGTLRTFEPWPGCVNNPGGDTIWSIQSPTHAVLAQQTTCPPIIVSGCVMQWTIDSGDFVLASNSTATYQLFGREVIGTGCEAQPGSVFGVRKVVNPMNRQ